MQSKSFRIETILFVSVILLLIGVFLWLFGVFSTEQPGTPTSNGTPAGQGLEVAQRMLSEPEGDLPELQTAIKFASEVDAQPPAKAEGPQDVPLLRWNFSTESPFQYAYSQKVVADTTMGNAGHPMKQNMTSVGKLTMKGQGDHTARMILEDMKVTMEVGLPAAGARGSPKEPMTMEAPTMVVAGVKEDGSMPSGMSQQEEMLKLLFPLPPQALKVGESVEVPALFPFNAAGSVLMVKGKSTLTLTGFSVVNGQTCARINTRVLIDKLDIPPEVKGTFRCAVSGEGVSYFDLQKRCFAKAAMALSLSVRADMPVPAMTFPGKAPPIDMPKTMRSVMDMNTFISIHPETP